MYSMIKDGNGGRRVWKKKFLLAIISLLFGYAVVIWMLSRVTTVTVSDIATMLASLTTFTLGVLGPIYAADIADKKLNGGAYNPKPDG